MLLFRSEEHLDQWLRDHELERGATMTVAQQWALARAWYGKRMEPEWRRRTPEEAQEVFEELGLSGAFWALT
jgi:hypothetical protein